MEVVFVVAIGWLVLAVLVAAIYSIMRIRQGGGRD
jgi:hypothetical protein